MNYLEISVQELKKRMEEDPYLQLLDVREPFEVEIGFIPGSIKIPMEIVPLKIKKLDNSKEIYVYCKSGIRSARICNYLAYNQFEKVYNIKGGIKAWSNNIDANISVG